jgi:tetratricopeptide (TPR) repeat protein
MFDVRRLFAALRPVTAETPYDRGTAHARAGRHGRALAEFQAAAASAQELAARAAAQNKCGVALVALGRRSEAVDTFCAALEADERCIPALLNLGNLLFEDGHPLDAVDYYEGAIRIDAGSALAYRNLSAALRRLGRRSAAVRALKTAVRLEARRPRRAPA